MARRALALAGVLLCLTGTAQAQNTVDANNGVAQVTAIARSFGTVEQQRQDNGSPRLLVTNSKGILSVVNFGDCSGERCGTISFYAGFANAKPTLEVINNWNRDKRFGAAYLDADLDASVRYDVSFEQGASYQNIVSDFEVWSLILEQFITHIGYQP